MPEKILIVDDDVDTLKLVGLILQRQGYQIAAANGGQAALAKASADKPDLILLDLMMPDLDGYEVARRLRADPVTSHIPIIMFTAKTLLDDKVAGFEAGADDYLTKPTHPAELVAHVKALLTRAKTTRATSPLEAAKLVGIIGAKGGVGTSTVAANLAALAAKEGRDVVLADLYPGSGSLGLMLGTPQNNQLASLLTKPAGELSPRLVSEKLHPHPSGLRALTGLTSPRDAGLTYNAAQLEATARALTSMCKLAVLDLGCGLGDANRRVASVCDYILVVSEPSRLGVTQAKALLTDLAMVGISGNRVDVVMVNRMPAANQLTMAQMEQQFGQKVLMMMAQAVELAYQAVEAATPMALLRPETTTSDQFRALSHHTLQRLGMA